MNEPGGEYYSEKLSAERLRECYSIAPPRAEQYLRSEVEFAASLLIPGSTVLELGCGYGRVCFELAETAERVVGIDISGDSIAMAGEPDNKPANCEFLEMDALRMTFPDGEFDSVICVQNGICAFGVDQVRLVEESLRVTRPGGRAAFSTYSGAFWQHRLEWFRMQAKAGLIGEIDEEQTGGGTIVCRDGLRLGMVTPDRFREIGEAVGLEPDITEVDRSSLFAVWIVPG